MGFKDVMALRQEGKLEEALLLARADYKEEPNQWSASALFWVLKDIATNLIAEQKNDKATPLVAEMEGLVNEMGATVNVAQETVQQLQKEVIPHYNEIEQLLTEQRKTKQFLALEEGFLKANAWHTAKKKGLHPALHDAYAEIMLLYLERKAKELSYEQFMEYIQSYLALQNQRPSNLHSRYLRLVLRAKRAYESQLHLQSFLKEWNLTLLQPSDWKRKKQEGESISLAENTLEQAVWEAYLHHQFTGEEVHLPAPYYQMLLEVEALFPHEEWLALTKCRMQVLDGQTELALELYEQLLVTTDFAQPWYEYALLCTEPTLRAAALCKALQMEENIYLDYVNHARIELAKCLVEEQLFANALRELDVYAQIKLEKGQPTAPFTPSYLLPYPNAPSPIRRTKSPTCATHAQPRSTFTAISPSLPCWLPMCWPLSSP